VQEKWGWSFFQAEVVAYFLGLETCRTTKDGNRTMGEQKRACWWCEAHKFVGFVSRGRESERVEKRGTKREAS
jgi:hypothetical protein